MDLMAAIGLLSSIVTLEEAGRSWVLIVKDKLKRKEIDINNWDSDDPLVQACLDRFKTDMGDKYKDHIFSEEEIQEIIRGFFEQNRELRIGNEEKKKMTQIIEDILYAYNEHTKSLMSSGERTLHNTLSSDFSKIMDKLGVIEEQPHKENIKKFLRAIEISKEIELENIEELINGEYEIDRSEIIETIQAGREKLVSIQGNAGSGKSVVCKKLLKGKEYVLVTRAENLSTGKKVNELWDCDVEDAILWLENKPLYIFIDAIEFIADCGDNAFTLLQEIYRLADKYSKGKRDDIEKKIRILETYVNSIPEDYVRNILEKRLFLCKGRYSRWDVNKVKAEYSYKDKCFLNVQIEKYGSNHLNDVLYTVYLLNISELLPEILTSISSCFTKAIRNSKEQFAKEIIDSQMIVDMIILKSFIFYSDEIKKDEKLINAYEDILLALTEIRNEKAAVLLDEFRIH